MDETGCTSAAARVAALAAILVFFASSPAEAYIDPGAGGMLVQLILGGIAAAAVVFRGYLARLRQIVRPRRTGDRAPDR